MPDPTPRPIARPRGDDRPLWNVVCGLTGLPAVLVAHDLKLFPLLAERPRSVAEVSAALTIAPRPAAALLTLCASLGLRVVGQHFTEAQARAGEDKKEGVKSALVDLGRLKERRELGAREGFRLHDFAVGLGSPAPWAASGAMQTPPTPSPQA